MNDFSSNSGAALGIIPIVFLIGLYVYFAFCQSKIAQKTGHSDTAWWSWIPILNTFLLFKMAGKPAWWFVLCLIPVVNIVVFAMLWWEVAKAARVAPAWGIMVLVPVVNFVAMGIMAFSTPPQQMAPPSHPQQPQPRQPEHVG